LFSHFVSPSLPPNWYPFWWCDVMAMTLNWTNLVWIHTGLRIKLVLHPIQQHSDKDITHSRITLNWLKEVMLENIAQIGPHFMSKRVSSILRTNAPYCSNNYPRT
jgi:hypothetical protein